MEFCSFFCATEITVFNPRINKLTIYDPLSVPSTADVRKAMFVAAKRQSVVCHNIVIRWMWKLQQSGCESAVV